MRRPDEQLHNFLFILYFSGLSLSMTHQIVSPSNMTTCYCSLRFSNEYIIKLNLNNNTGVSKYWIVDTDNKEKAPTRC